MADQLVEQIDRVVGARGPAMRGSGSEDQIELLPLLDQLLRQLHRGLEGHHVVGHAVNDHQMVAQVLCIDRKSTRLNSSHQIISYAVFCLKKKKISQKTYKYKTEQIVKLRAQK